MTSQIFANIYLHELDRFVKHTLKVPYYLRYGDDFTLFHRDRTILETARRNVRAFLESFLCLTLHARNDVLLPCRTGLKFLGYEIFPKGRRLKRRTVRRLIERLDLRNASSYRGLALSEGSAKRMKEFQWRVLRCLSR